MKQRSGSRTSLFLALGVLLMMTGPVHALEEVTTEAAAAQQDQAEIAAPAEIVAPEDPAALPDAEEPLFLTGCTATYNCVHGGTVQCNSPTPGTCTSSGFRCGVVTCNDVSTFCPGACISAHHCFEFCLSQGSTDGGCDQFGCCFCL